MSCPSTEELYSQPALRESSHVQSCPRCNARLASLSEFLQPSAKPVDASVAEAEQELRRRLARDIRSRATQAKARRSLLLRPVFYVPVAAVAATLLVALWLRPFDSAETGTLRSTTPAPLAKLALSADSHWSGSRLVLGWNAVEGAERYLVVVYSSDLRELTSKEIEGAEHCELPIASATGSRSLWVRVRALRAGAVLEDSGLLLLSAKF